MSLTKIRPGMLSGAVGTKESLDTASSDGTGAVQVPSGTTAQRPVNPTVGYMRYNTTSGYFETYTSSGWGSISTPPLVTGVSPTSYNGESGTSFTITGSFFDSYSSVKFITSQGAEYSAATVSFVNASQLIATTPQDFTVAQEPLGVRVVNGAGLSYTLAQVIDCGGSPSWNTASGLLSTVYEGESVSTSISATDPDANSTISYSIASGLPSGVTINSSTGSITGTAGSVSSDTTYNFTAVASDNAGNEASRAFSIVVKDDVTNTANIRFGFNNSTTNSGNQGTAISLYNGYSFNSSIKKYGSHSLDLNGSSGYGNITMTSGLQTFTVAYWIYWRGHNSLGRTYLVDYRAGGSGGYWLIDSPGTMTVYGGGSEKSTSWTPALNTWEHYAYVSDGSNGKVYRNGSLVWSPTGAGLTSATAAFGTYEGARGSSGNYFANACFDNFIMYNSALNADQILSLYNSTKDF